MKTQFAIVPINSFIRSLNTPGLSFTYAFTNRITARKFDA